MKLALWQWLLVALAAGLLLGWAAGWFKNRRPKTDTPTTEEEETTPPSQGG